MRCIHQFRYVLHLSNLGICVCVYVCVCMCVCVHENDVAQGYAHYKQDIFHRILVHGADLVS